MGLGARSNIRSKYLRTRSSWLTSSYSRYWSLWTRIWVIRDLVQRKLKTNIICYTNSLHRLISLAGKHTRKNGWFLICQRLLLMELSLITANLQAIAFPLETSSSAINAVHTGGTKIYDMKYCHEYVRHNWITINSARNPRQNYLDHGSLSIAVLENMLFYSTA